MYDDSNEEIEREMDSQLHRCFAEVPSPVLSNAFDQTFHNSLHPPSLLNRKGRVLMTSYVLAALAISIWLMRTESISWIHVMLVLVISVAIAYLVNFLHLLRHLIRV